MGSSFTTIKNVSNENGNGTSPTCVPCPHGNKPGNPGTFEDIHKKFENIEAKNFDGARIIAKKILSKHFNITHTLLMRSKTPFEAQVKNILTEDKAYQFSTSYTGIKRVGFNEKYPILTGEISPDGDLTANFVHTLGCRCRIKLNTKINKNIYKNVKASAEYRSDDFTLTATLINPRLLKQEGIVVLQYLQSITSRIAIGAELSCQKSTNLPVNQQSIVACALRYSTGFRTFTTTISPSAVRVTCHFKESPQLQMGVEFRSNFLTRESKAKLVYQVDVPVADIVCKCFVDSDWRLGTVLEKKLYPIPEGSLILSALIDHVNKNVIVGIGLNIGR